MIVFVITMFSNDVKYEAVRDEEIVTYSKCYKEHGQNVCEMPLLKNKVVVDDFWKKQCDICLNDGNENGGVQRWQYQN